MASLFVYRFQVLPILNENLIEEIERVILDFLWRGKRAKIPLATLKKAREDGGLGLVDIKTKHLSLLFG